MIHPSAAQGFARAPADYERGRPDYPAAAIQHLVQVLGIRRGRRVLDLAAGTGKLTRRLAATGADVVAVEPVAEMRARLVEAVPAAESLPGRAEAIPLPDGSIGAVAVGQGFHWFDGEAALAEIHRVLRAGHRLGLIWNVRDEADPFLRALTKVMAPYRGRAPAYASGAWRAAFETTELFTPLEHERFSFEHEADPEGVVARVTSVSFIAALPEPRREEVVSRVRELLATDPATRGRDRIVLPYFTDVFWCERL